MLCAVCGCNNYKNSSYKKKKERISYFSFPTDPDLLEQWVQFCKRKKRFNATTARICSDHFKAEDFERNIQFEMGFTAKNRVKLKPGSVPTVYTETDATARRARTRKKTEEAKDSDPNDSAYSVSGVLEEEASSSTSTNSASCVSAETVEGASTSGIMIKLTKPDSNSSSNEALVEEASSSTPTEKVDSANRVKRRKTKKVRNEESVLNNVTAVEEQESNSTTSSEGTCVAPETEKPEDGENRCEECRALKTELEQISTAIVNLDEENCRLKQEQEKMQDMIKSLQLQVKKNPFVERPPKFKKRKKK